MIIPDDHTTTLRRLVWDTWDTASSSATIPHHIREVLRSPEVYDAVMTHYETDTADLVCLIRLHDEPAALALYARYLRMLESHARRYGSLGGPAYSHEDAHQEAAITLYELARDMDTPPERVAAEASYTIRRAVEDAAVHVAFTTSVPRRILDRVKRALHATDADPYAAAEWASTRPAWDRLLPETFWRAYHAVFQPVTVVCETTQDATSEDALTSVENRALVAQILSWDILDDRELDILTRSYLYTGQRETDEQIAFSLGIHRSRVVQIRSQALISLRAECAAEHWFTEPDTAPQTLLQVA
jgi:RNA polymerase sigma factor (sigma-70 family)